jgi:alkanesulfonate monooxygenase SsuD/methylene tetrahydromethanopterin reductase-like flavin-dependent oxidoreductase (luciferase family)
MVEGGELDSLLTCASLADHTTCVRLVAVVPTGAHPVHLAERIAVADQALAGRLVVCLVSGDADELAETVEVLEKALSPRPFTHNGRRWQIPARRPENAAAHGKTLRVTPSPAQERVPIWLTGQGADEVGADYALPVLFAGGTDAPDAAPWWEAMDSRWGHPAQRMTRPLVVTARGGHASSAAADLLSTLRHAQDTWKLETALVRWDGPVNAAAVRTTAALRAAVQLDVLPVGLHEFWAATWPVDRLLDA